MKLGKTKKIVQGSYISIETKRILVKEAKKQKIFTTTLVSQILEKEALRIDHAYQINKKAKR